jgi:hypothetical protein
MGASTGDRRAGTMTNDSKKRFAAEWVRVHATIILTRRGGLTIVDTKRNTGLDLHVFVDREDKPMRLTCGVLLRWVLSAVTPKHANRILRTTMAQFQGMRKFTYPVCLFFFSMGDERAFFSWLAEPVLADGAPKLVHHEKANCVELTDEKLDQVVEQVVAWYDAVEVVLIA